MKLRAAARAIFGLRCSVSLKLRPVGAKPFAIEHPRGELLGVGGGAHELALAHAVDLALHELIDERRNLGIAAGPLQRAQFEPQCRGVRARFLAQHAEDGESFERLALLQLHFGFEHQSRHRETRHRRIGARQKRLRGGELAGGDGGPRAEQRRQSRRVRYRERFLGELPRAAEAALEQRDESRIMLRAGALLMLALPVDAHFFRQPQRAPDDAQQHVTRDEAAHDEEEQKVERQLHPIRRRDEERITCREPRRQRDGHRSAGEEEKPEEDAHSLSASPVPRRLLLPERDPVRAAARATLRGSASSRASRRAWATRQAA